MSIDAVLARQIIRMYADDDGLSPEDQEKLAQLGLTPPQVSILTSVLMKPSEEVAFREGALIHGAIDYEEFQTLLDYFPGASEFLNELTGRKGSRALAERAKWFTHEIPSWPPDPLKQDEFCPSNHFQLEALNQLGMVLKKFPELGGYLFPALERLALSKSSNQAVMVSAITAIAGAKATAMPVLMRLFWQSRGNSEEEQLRREKLYFEIANITFHAVRFVGGGIVPLNDEERNSIIDSCIQDLQNQDVAMRLSAIRMLESLAGPSVVKRAIPALKRAHLNLNHLDAEEVRRVKMKAERAIININIGRLLW